jgi:hypothetical protein
METVSPGSPSKEKLTDREVAAAIAAALVQGKSRQQIVEHLVAIGLSEESARAFVGRAIPL